MAVVISTNKLTKRYAGSPVTALKDLSIQINSGEVYGFLGPNGAGKSTAIRLLLNFIQPTAGSATLLGFDSIKDSVNICQRSGYLSGDFTAYPKMTVKQFLDFMNELQPPKRRGYRDELASLFRLNVNQKVGALSKGSRQKVGIIQAFMHEPELLVLDEPTGGLDPLMQETFYGLIASFKQNGGTAFVSSHNLSEVQKMCDRIGFIRAGKLIAEQTIAELAHEASQTFDITFANKPPVAALKRLKGMQKVTVGNHNNVTLHMHGELSPLFSLLAKNKVKNLSTRELNLEHEFMHYYEGEA